MFCDFYPFEVFFYQFDPRYFNCYFFPWNFFKIDIFFSDVMLPHSICWKLSSGLRFHELLVWKINLGLENLSRFTIFSFFKLFFLVSSLGIYLIGDWTLLFFYLLFIGFFTNFDNNSGYLGSFYLSFSVNFKFFYKFFFQLY